MKVARIRPAVEGNAQNDKRERLLQKVFELATERLCEAVRLMMDRVDDALFELAEKSENDAAQRSYFDAMREVRVKRAEVEDQFRSEFQDVIKQRCGHKPGDGPGAQVLNLDDMSLIAEDDFEEDIAVGNMVTKIAGNAQDELFALNQRTAYLMRREELNDDANPVGPRAICESMRKACTPIEAGIEIRLLVLKIFDQYVVNDVPAMYNNLNQYLIEHKVLPNLRHKTSRRGAVRRPATAARNADGGFAPGGLGPAAAPFPGSGGAGGEMADGAELGGEAGLLALLQQLTGGGGPGGAAPAGAGGGAAMPGSAGGFALSPQVLGTVQSLTLLQQGDSQALASAGIDSGLISEGNAGQNILRNLSGSVVMKDLEASKRMTVDIVAMLFDCILDDEKLPESIKNQIARLQIPMVKVALLDPEFFSHRSHPARGFLNAVAEAAATHGQNPDALDILRDEVARLIQRVVDEFDDDVELFKAVAEEFRKFTSVTLAEKLIRSERSAQVAQGRAKVEQAKIFARSAVEKTVNLHGHMDLVYNFLLNHWKHLLITSYVEFGEDSAELAEAIRTMEELAWSVSPARDSADASKLGTMLPGLLKRLKRGLEAVSAPPIARKRFFEKLAAAHGEIARRGKSEAEVKAAAEPVAEDVDPDQVATIPNPSDERTSALREARDQAQGEATVDIASAPPPEAELTDEPAPELPGAHEPVQVTSGDINDETLPEIDATEPDEGTSSEQEIENAGLAPAFLTDDELIETAASANQVSEPGERLVPDSNDETLPEIDAEALGTEAPAELEQIEISEDTLPTPDNEVVELVRQARDEAPDSNDETLPEIDADALNGPLAESPEVENIDISEETLPSPDSEVVELVREARDEVTNTDALEPDSNDETLPEIGVNEITAESEGSTEFEDSDVGDTTLPDPDSDVLELVRRIRELPEGSGVDELEAVDSVPSTQAHQEDSAVNAVAELQAVPGDSTLPEPDAAMLARVREIREQHQDSTGAAVNDETLPETGIPVAQHDPNDDTLPDQKPDFSRTLPGADIKTSTFGADIRSSVDEAQEDTTAQTLVSEEEMPHFPGEVQASQSADLATLLSERLDNDGAVSVADLLASKQGKTREEVEAETILDIEPEANDSQAVKIDINEFLAAEHNNHDIDELLASGDLDVEEITMGDDGDADENDDADAGSDELAALTTGTMMSLTMEDGSEMSVRLAWINDVTDTYVFADARGKQVASRTRKGLELDMRRGTARICDSAQDQPLLERAFSRLLDGLHHKEA